MTVFKVTVFTSMPASLLKDYIQAAVPSSSPGPRAAGATLQRVTAGQAAATEKQPRAAQAHCSFQGESVSLAWFS